jgi:hypothetical protein
MHGLIGTRLLKQFLGDILHRPETGAMDQTGLPENGGKTTDQLDNPKSEKAQGQPKDEPHEENRTKISLLIQKINNMKAIQT